MDNSKIKKELKSRVAKGLNFGVEAVEEVLQTESDLYNQFILLKSKYNDLMYMSSLNTLAYEQVALGLDRLRNHLIHIIDQMEDKHLGKTSVEQNLNISALPTRRANFFKLLDIHYLNLESIHYAEYIGAEISNRQQGRKAMFELLQGHRRRLNNSKELDTTAWALKLKEHFAEWFKNEIVGIEVYVKNIKHMLQYALASEVEQEFFLATLRSLFSRYEQAFLFYYAFSEIDPQFSSLLRKGQVIDDAVRSVLMREEDFDLFFSA